MNTRDACVQALSDAQFVAPLVQTGDLFTLRHTKRPNGVHGAPVPVHDADKEPLPRTYFYVFDYQMRDGDYPQVSKSQLVSHRCHHICNAKRETK